jgi:hypothetical protein
MNSSRRLIAAVAVTAAALAGVTLTPQTAEAVPTVPGAPATCSAFDVTGDPGVVGSKADIHWAAPASDGGAAVYRYAIQRVGFATPVHGTDTESDGFYNNPPKGGAARDWRWSDAFVSRSDTFRVRAVNSVGFGAWCTTGPVYKTNNPPTVNAGPDATVTMPSTGAAHVPVDGTVTDGGDGPGPLTSAWTSNSGAVSFASGPRGGNDGPDNVADITAPGTYVLTLTGNDGGDVTPAAQDTVTITVNPFSANAAPSVSAGPDRAVTLPASASLDGTVTDDGKPTGSTVTQTWSKTSGPGTVTFGDSSAVDTTASFSLSGTYVLALTATDGALSSSDAVTVVVSPAQTTTVPGAPATCQATDQGASVLVEWTPPASDGGSAIIRYAVKVKGGATTIQVNDPAARSYVWTGAYLATDTMQVRAVNSVGFGAWCETAITGTPPPTNQAPSVSAGADQSIVLPSSANLNGTVTDDGLPAGSTVTQAWSVVSGPGAVTFGDATAEDTTATFSVDGTYVLRLTGSDGTLSSSDDMTVTVAPAPPNNSAPSVNAGVDQSVTLPSAASLDGTVTDDGLPAGSTLSQTWSKVSGPGTVTFGDSTAQDTTAAFSTSGTYVLRLTGTDGALSSSDDVTVTVNPAPPVNQAPSVNAGPDSSVTLPSAAGLDGTASDDGLPSGSTLATTWSKVSGPGTVTFGNASAQDTTATFSAAGSYVLRLTASDGTLSSSDTVTITVNPAASGRPLLPYTSGAWIRQTIAQLGLSQNGTKTTAMRTYINANDPNPAPNIQGIDGQGWADAYGGISTCSDPYFKIGTGNKMVPFLGTTGFHAKATLNGDIDNTVGTDLPFTVIDTCGNSAMPTGFVVKGTGAVTAGGAGTQANPYVINVGGYAGAYDMASNGLNFDVPTSNGPNNKTSRGVIPASAVIRDDQIGYGMANSTDLGQRLEIFWWETDSAAGKISPPMAGFESGQAGWGAEGQVIGVSPSFVPSASCTAGEKVVIRTLQTYGAFIGDNAGNGGTSLKAEQDHGQWTAADGLSQQGLANDCGLTWNSFVAY